MLSVEVQAHRALPPAKRDRFEFLLSMRSALARTSAELSCWGVGTTPMIDRQLVLVEDALTALVVNVRLAATLSARWAAEDAKLLHQSGTAPEWCTVCQHGGYGVEDTLRTLGRVSD